MNKGSNNNGFTGFLIIFGVFMFKFRELSTTGISNLSFFTQQLKLYAYAETCTHPFAC